MSRTLGSVVDTEVFDAIICTEAQRAAAVRTRLPGGVDPEVWDVADPIGRGRQAYVACRDELEARIGSRLGSGADATTSDDGVFGSRHTWLMSC